MKPNVTRSALSTSRLVVFGGFLLIAAFITWHSLRITGTYVAKADNAAILLQLVESNDGKLEGQYQSLFINDDGSLKSEAYSVSGDVDGWDISLSLKEMGFLPVTETVSGKFNGFALTLAFVSNKGQPFVQNFSTSNISEFQNWSNELRKKSQSILATKVMAEHQVRLEQQRRSFVSATDALVHQMQDVGTHIDATLKTLPQGNARYRAITSKVQAYYERARSLSGDRYALPRNQILVAMNQGLVATNQVDVEVQSIHSSYAARVNPLLDQLSQAERSCPALEPTINVACQKLADAGNTFKSKVGAFSAMLKQLENAYHSELAAQQAMIDGIEQIQ